MIYTFKIVPGIPMFLEICNMGHPVSMYNLYCLNLEKMHISKQEKLYLSIYIPNQ